MPWRPFAPKNNFFFYFSPFNLLLSETERKSLCQTKQRVAKICPEKSTSVPSADRWTQHYTALLEYFKMIYENELEGKINW